MVTKENLHSGHRERMMERFLCAPESLADHEILELLLYYALPRVDTNPIAHRLLRTFGSLKGVFNATPQQLASIDGLGERSAIFVAVLGQLGKRMQISTDPLLEISKFSFNENKHNLKAFFSGLKEEVFIAILLDAKQHFINYVKFSNYNHTSVTAEIPELAHALALNRPAFVVVSHNHPSGIVLPSKEDDVATAKINAICYVAGAKLLDHIICTDNDVYSYHYANTLNQIKDEYNIETLFNTK